MGKWKAIQLNLHNDADSPIRLYDLDADLAEQHDLAAEHPELVARFRKIFAEAHKPSETWRFKSSIKTPSGSQAN
jgi:arylsulfatase